MSYPMFQHQVLTAAFKAGEAIMEIYGTTFEVDTKSDDSPVTLADHTANRIILNYLEPLGIPVISEETEVLSYDIRKDWDRCFIVDPLDGTKEFVNRNGDFTVNIALVENGIPAYGVIYIPTTRELYVGNVSEKIVHKLMIKNGDNVLFEMHDDGHVLNPLSDLAKAGPKREKEMVRLAGSRSHMNDETKDFARSLVAAGKEVHWIARGSSLKFCLLAEGKADVYPRFSPTMEWDTAAGHAICKAMGIPVIDQHTGKELVYNRSNLRNNSFVAG